MAQRIPKEVSIRFYDRRSAVAVLALALLSSAVAFAADPPTTPAPGTLLILAGALFIGGWFKHRVLKMTPLRMIFTLSPTEKEGESL